ncbi:DUF1566 domain-containing protein [bacterium]|nr:DUF1566 domain-containing protein [bacterium]
MSRRTLLPAAAAAALSVAVALADTPPPPPAPGAAGWGEVRVSQDRMPAAEFAFSPTGTELAFFGYNRAYHLYDVATGRVTREVPTDVSVHNVSYSPDGKVLATAEWFAGARLRDPATGAVRNTLTPDSGLGVFAVAFQPDGRLAAHCWRADGGAGGTMREQLAVWELATRKQAGGPATARVEANGEMIRRRFAGRFLLSVETRSLNGYVVARAAGVTDPAGDRPPTRAPLDLDDDQVFDVSPDGKSLLVFNINRPPRLVDAATGRTTRLLIGHRQYVTAGAFSPDGKLVVTAAGTTRRTNLAPAVPPPAGAPTDLIIWEAETGRKVAAFQDPARAYDYASVRFSPDGRFVAAVTRPEEPKGKERKGGVLVVWGKLPAAGGAGGLAATDADRLGAEVAGLRAEVAGLRAEVDRLRRLREVPPGTPEPAPTPRPVPPIPPAAGRFVDRGDHVEDTRTGLLWQKDGTVSGARDYYDAFRYAVGLELGGRAGWRVPTRAELADIFPATAPPFTGTRYNPAPYGKGAGEWASYWTADVDPSRPDYAYVYHWYAAGGANSCLASRNKAFVRCVHDPVKR